MLFLCALIIATLLPTYACSAVTVEQAYYDLGVALHTEGSNQEALAIYHQLLKRVPTHSGALKELSALCVSLQHYTDAESYLELLMHHEPNNPDNLLQLAQLHLHCNKLTQAQQTGLAALACAPTSWKMHQSYAQILQQADNHEAAYFHYQMAHLLNPTDIELCLRCGDLLTAHKKYHEAATYYEKAYACNPNMAHLRLQQAQAFISAGNTQKALDLYQKLLATYPTSTDLIHHIAYAHAHNGNWHEAQTWYEKIPNKNAQARNGYAQTLLALGNLQQGFAQLAEKTVPGIPDTHIMQSPYQAANKTVVLGASWDYNDMVQLIRYATLLQRYGASKIIAQVPHDFMPLARICRAIDAVVDCREPLPAHHWYLPLFNASHIFKTILETVPPFATYLKPPSQLVAQWRTRYLHTDNTKLNVGLYLHSDEESLNAQTIPLNALASLAELPSVNWYLLSPPPAHSAPAQLPTTCILHQPGTGFSCQGQDLVDLAAIISLLDVVITKDCVVAHIAGALGKPVFVLLPMVANWRWMTERTDSPWYPTMRLFRQKKPGDWLEVMEEVKKTLFTFKQ